MVRQHEDGYFINGVWHSGEYTESTICEDVSVFEKHTQPINITPQCTCHECKCEIDEVDEVEMYKVRMIIGALCLAVVIILGLFVFL